MRRGDARSGLRSVRLRGHRLLEDVRTEQRLSRRPLQRLRGSLCIAPLGVPATSSECKVSTPACNASTPNTCGPVGTFQVGSDPEGIAFDGTNMWVTNYGSENVTELLPDGGRLGLVTVGSDPEGIAFDGTNMWVTHDFGSSITELLPDGGVSASSRSLMAYSKRGGSRSTARTCGSAQRPTVRSRACMSCGRMVEYSHSLSGTPICRRLPSRSTERTCGSRWCSAPSTSCCPMGTLGPFPVGRRPTGIAFDGTNMWVTNADTNNVTELLPDGGSLGPFPVGSDPAGIAFDGTHMWVANYGSNSITELSLDGGVAGTFDAGVGSQPYTIAFDGKHVWVANAGTGTVTEW